MKNTKPSSFLFSPTIGRQVAFAVCFGVVTLIILARVLKTFATSQDPTAIETVLIRRLDAKSNADISNSPEPIIGKITRRTDEIIDISDLKSAFPNATIKVRDIKQTSIDGRCLAGKTNGRRILINYASNCCQRSQPKNCDTGLTVGGFDVCIMFSEKSLDDEFRRQNSKIFADKTGGGYWLWKPYIILKTLYTMQDNDVLFYADSGTHFIENVDRGHICLQQQFDQDVVVFSDAHPEHCLTKADTFVLMGISRTDAKFADSFQLIAAYFLARKSFRSIRFVGEWLTYAQDGRIIDNSASQFAKNPPDFRGHRNDQSILSLLSKKWGFEIWPDPSQWGELGANAELRKTERYKLIGKTFFAHTRDKS